MSPRLFFNLKPYFAAIAEMVAGVKWQMCRGTSYAAQYSLKQWASNEAGLGKANNNGTILINKNLNPSKTKKVVDHEMVHIDQFKRGDLDYDDNNVYWKGKTYSRSQMQEGAKALPWEKEAYDKA